MKTKEQILDNLNGKLGLWISDFNNGDRLKEHIIMLDWVLTDGYVRDIETIIAERC